LRIFRSGASGQAFLNNTSNNIANVSIGTISSTAESNILQKYSAGFKQNDYAFYANNTLIGTDTNGAMPISPTTLTIGDAAVGFTPRLYTNGIISSIRYYRRRLPNPKLQALTQLDPDPDVKSYIDAVEIADGQALEDGVKIAYETFIKGCKSDGIWGSIKSSCILAGARTLSGALVPLRGAAPTNFNFISDDYNRKTGLKGDGFTKYLNSNLNNTATPQNNRHMSVYVTTAPTINGGFIGAGFTQVGADHIARVATIFARSVNTSIDIHTAPISSTGLMGISRSLSLNFQFRVANNTLTFTRTSETPYNQNNVVFGRDGAPQSDARLSFYSIGESLNLATLDSRVSTLMSELSAAIL
jgi:hypothetical protein